MQKAMASFPINILLFMSMDKYNIKQIMNIVINASTHIILQQIKKSLYGKTSEESKFGRALEAPSRETNYTVVVFFK